MFVKKNDTVKVISGDDHGKEGKIIKVLYKDNKIIVQGINLAWKHLKRSADYPHGARIQKEAPINVSNIMLVCPNCNKPTRIGFQKSPTGQKTRTCKKCKQPVTTA